MSRIAQPVLALLLSVAVAVAAFGLWTHWDGLSSPTRSEGTKPGRQAAGGGQAGMGAGDTPSGGRPAAENRTRSESAVPGDLVPVDAGGRRLGSLAVVDAAPATDGGPALLVTLRLVAADAAPFAVAPTRVGVRDNDGFLSWGEAEAGSSGRRDRAAREDGDGATPASGRGAARGKATPAGGGAAGAARDRNRERGERSGRKATPTVDRQRARPADRADATPVATAAQAAGEVWTVPPGTEAQVTVRIPVRGGARIAQVVYAPTTDRLLVIADYAAQARGGDGGG